MYCSKCGTQLADGTLFCTSCGQAVQSSTSQAQVVHDPIAPAPTPPTYIPPIQQQPSQQQPAQYNWQAPRSAVAYAGFWLRMVAFIIDAIILGIAGAVVFFPLFSSNLRAYSSDNFWELYTSMSRPLVAVRLLGVMMTWVYYATLESSAWQATLGKKALGLKVTDLAGNRISFARASGRYFGMFLSEFTLGFGFLMAGFTERKQALHDIVAGCLVLRQL
jgi:uncharacterized RDD family membrane protein YckC